MPGLRSARAAWLALIALQLVWFGWLAPAETLGRSGGLLLAVAPLLLPLWPILRLNLDGLVIGGLLLLVYFCFAVVEAWISTGPMVRVLALLEIALILLYYLALLSVRRRRPGAARSD
ncbi:MAG: DUF2069 domain-containing protein [Wenzhouxiangellaceae bacterium]|nr:DUF2069 domain-containing protein [Wenzhouxiangellaceae bacterium]